MKKSVAILLAVCLLMAVVMGCSSGKTAENSATPEPTVQNTEDAGGGIDTVPSEYYNDYLEAKVDALERINNKFEENPNLVTTGAVWLMLVSGVDMYLIPLTLVGLDAENYAYAQTMLGLNGIDIQRNGQTYTITYSDEEGVTTTMTCEYDAASNSMQATVTDGDETTMFFEYVGTSAGDGYASQYYIKEGDEYQLIKTYFNKTDIVACGIKTADETPASIFKNGNLDENFVINEEMYVILEGDALTVFEDGELNTF